MRLMGEIHDPTSRRDQFSEHQDDKKDEVTEHAL
jgi:hypothetical protein